MPFTVFSSYDETLKKHEVEEIQENFQCLDEMRTIFEQNIVFIHSMENFNKDLRKYNFLSWDFRSGELVIVVDLDFDEVYKVLYWMKRVYFCNLKFSCLELVSDKSIIDCGNKNKLVQKKDTVEECEDEESDLSDQSPDSDDEEEDNEEQENKEYREGDEDSEEEGEEETENCEKKRKFGEDYEDEGLCIEDDLEEDYDEMDIETDSE